jgi:hypothetical protein
MSHEDAKLCARDTRFWEVIFPRNGLHAAGFIVMGIAVRLVVFRGTAPKTKTTGRRFDSKCRESDNPGQNAEKPRSGTLTVR